MKVKVTQLYLTLCNPMDFVHGILQARILEWVALPFSRGIFQPRDQTQVSHIAGRFFTSWATREALKPPFNINITSDQIRSDQSLSRVRLFATPRIAARRASLSIANSRSSLHVHRVTDAIQPSHPLSSPSPPAPNPSQHQSLFQWVNSSNEVAKVLEFQL